MPTLLQQLAMAQSQGTMRAQPKKRVVVYSPGRAVPTQQQQQAQPQGPAQRPVGQRPARSQSQARGDAITAAEQAFLNSPAAQKQREQQAQKQAEANAPDQPWWKEGLGMVIGNPIVKNALMPLNLLGIPRRAIQLGIESLAEHTNLGDLPGWAKAAAIANPLTMVAGAASLVDTKRTEADKRSNVSKVFDLNSDYGFGQLISDDLPGPIGGLAGLYGDVATDPLTYLTAGGSKVVQEGALAGKELALHGGKAERLAELSKLATRPLEEIQQLAPDIQRAGARGLGAASPELRDALGITAPRLRVAGNAIPGTERLAAPITAATGALREQINKVPAFQKLARGPKGLEAATNVLSRYGTETDVPRALTNVKLNNLMRLSSGEVKTRGNRLLFNLAKKDFKGLSTDAKRQVMREAETQPGENAVNKFFKDVVGTYQEVSGHNVEPFLKDPEHYVPHMMSPGFRRMLKEQLDKGNPIADDFMRKSGFVRDDLLEGSGYIEKARALQPNVDPITLAKSPADIPIGGQTITLKTGTIDELNSQLTKVFPGFRGEFYETDPIRIGESYIESLSRGAGARAASGTLADTGSELVERIGGPAGRGPALGQALDEANTARNAQQPLIDTMRTPVAAGDTIPPVAPAAPVPEDVAGIHLPDFFDEEVNRKATKAQQSFLRNEGKDWTKTVSRDISETRSAAAKDLANLRDNWSKGLKGDLQGAKKQIKVLDGRIKSYEDSLTAMGAHRTQTHDQLTAFLVGIRKDIDDLAEEMGTKTSYWKGRVTKATKAANAEMEKRYQQLRRVEARAKNIAERAPEKLKAELNRRVEQATAPAREAQAKIDEITARVPGRPSDERMASAEELMANRSIEVTDPHAALSDEYRNLLSKDPAARTARENTRIGELQQQLREPRQTSVASEFDKDTQRLNDVITQMESGAADPAEMAALRRERTSLRRRFQQNGKHAAEKRARDTMAEYKAWEAEVGKQTAGAKTDLAAAQRRQQLVVEDINKQLDIEAAVKSTQQRADATRRQSDKYRQRIDAPFDPGRDLGGPVGAERAKGVEAVQAVSRQREVAKDLEAEVLDTTRTELRKVDADMADQQVSMVRDAQERQPLLAKRDEAETLLKQLQGTTTPLKTVKGGVKYKPDEMLNVLDEIQSVARANPNLDDATLAATESVLQAHRQQLERVANNDLTAKQAQSLIDKSFKSGKDGLAPVMLTVLNDNWEMMHKGMLGKGDVIMDHELHRMFTNLYAMDKEPKWLGRTFNALTNLFKTYATLTPGFHVRNALSGIFMNTADGVALKAQYEGAKYWSQYMKHGEEVLKTWPEDVREAFKAAAGSGAGGQFTEPNNYVRGNRVYNTLANNRFTRSGILGKRGGERVEGALRLGMGIDTIRKGGTVEDALSRITRVHFDYSQVSRLDAQMKRVIPFWTFMSRNLPLQVSEMWTKPKTYAIYQSALRNLGSAPEQYTPQYWLDAGGTNTGINIPNLPGQEGGSLYFTPDIGFNRMQSDVENLGQAAGGDWGALLSPGNPWLTAPLEFASKRDFFTGQSYGPTDNTYADPITTALGKLMGQTNEAGQVQIPFQNMLRSVNPLMDRSIRLAPQIAGGTDKDKSRQLESYARLLGVPARVLTPTAQDSEYWRQYYDAKDEQDRVRKMLELQARQAG